MKKILVPCDFSDTAVEAFSFAVNIADATHGEVLVLHVLDMPVVYESTLGMHPYLLDAALFKEIQDGAKKKFESIKKNYGKNLAAIQLIIKQGPVTPVIRECIKEQKPDLVVMGTNGASGLKEYFVGSNTEKIVRFSPVPVFAVRKAIAIDKVKNIVFATTLDQQPELVKKVKELQSFFSAMLHLLVVNTPANFRPDKEVKDAMQGYALHFNLRNYTLNFRNDYTLMSGILSFAYETKAEVIAMGTHGHWGLFHTLLGSVAEDVVNHASCPVWTFSMGE